MERPFALEIFVHDVLSRHLKNQHIKIFSDNTTAIAVINKMGSNNVFFVCSIAFRLPALTYQENCEGYYKIKWLPT